MGINRELIGEKTPDQVASSHAGCPRVKPHQFSYTPHMSRSKIVISYGDESELPYAFEVGFWS